MSGPRGAEWDLIEASQQGDRDAFGRLYATYAPKVTGFLQARLRDRALAQDLTSETFFRALRSIDSVSYQLADPGAWLTTIARNLVRDHWKSSRYRREHLVEDIGDASAEQDTPERAVIRSDTAATVRRGVDQLPAAVAQCVRLRYLDELTVAETAARMGRTQASVKGLTHRGLHALRALMVTEAGLGPSAPAAGPVRRSPAGEVPVVAPVREVDDPLLAARRALAGLRAGRAERDEDTTVAQRSDHLARCHAQDQLLAQRTLASTAEVRA